MPYARQNASQSATNLTENSTPLVNAHTNPISTSLNSSDASIAGPDASFKSNSPCCAAKLLPTVSRAGRDFNADNSSLQIRQTEQLRFRRLHPYSSLMGDRRTSPLTALTKAATILHLPPSASSAGSPTTLGGRYGILQELQKKVLHFDKEARCQEQHDRLLEEEQDPEPMISHPSFARETGGGMAPSRTIFVDENSENEENIPPAWDSQKRLLNSHGPRLKDTRNKSNTNRSSSQKQRDRHTHASPLNLNGYVESLEAEVTSLQIRLSEILTTSSALDTDLSRSAPSHATATCDPTEPQQGLRYPEQQTTGLSQDADRLRLGHEAALERVRQLEEQMRDREARCNLLEEQVRQSERRAQQAEAGERALSRRVDMFGAMVANSPAKITSTDTLSCTSAPATPWADEVPGFRQSNLKPRAAISTSSPATSAINPMRPVFPDRDGLSVQIDDERSWHQGIGAAEMIAESLNNTGYPSSDLEDALDNAFEVQSSANGSTCPTSISFADSREPSSSSRPLSLLSNASFSASWGLPASLGRACIDSLAASGAACKRPAPQAKRMRRFPSASGGLRPLILPNTAPCSELSPTRSTFSCSPSRPLSMSESFSPMSPSSFDPESLEALALLAIPDKEREQSQTLRQLQGMDDETNEQIPSRSVPDNPSTQGDSTTQQAVCTINIPRLETHQARSTPTHSPTTISPATPKASTQLLASTSTDAPWRVKAHKMGNPWSDIGLVKTIQPRMHNDQRSLPSSFTKPTGSNVDYGTSNKARFGILDRIKALANIVTFQKPRADPMIPLHTSSNNSNNRSQNPDTSPRNVLAGSLNKATEILKQISPFHFGGLGWWLFGLSHWHRKRAQSPALQCDQVKALESCGHICGDEMVEPVNQLDNSSTKVADSQRRLALDGPGECAVMRAEPRYKFVNEHTALLGLGLPSPTPIVTVTEAFNSPPLLRNLRLCASRPTPPGSKAGRIADQAIDRLLSQGGPQCPTCIEPFLRNRIRLWAKLGLGLILAVGVAILEGPESILGISKSEIGAQSLPSYRR